MSNDCAMMIWPSLVWINSPLGVRFFCRNLQNFLKPSRIFEYVAWYPFRMRSISFRKCSKLSMWAKTLPNLEKIYYSCFKMKYSSASLSRDTWTLIVLLKIKIYYLSWEESNLLGKLSFFKNILNKYFPTQDKLYCKIRYTYTRKIEIWNFQLPNF